MIGLIQVEGSENWGELGYSPRQRHDYTKLQNAARRDVVEQERKKRPNHHRPRPPELSSPPLRNEDGTVILMGPEELAKYSQEANDPKPRPHNPVGPAAVARHILREGGSSTSTRKIRYYTIIWKSLF